jgi:hypothetical protein
VDPDAHLAIEAQVLDWYHRALSTVLATRTATGAASVPPLAVPSRADVQAQFEVCFLDFYRFQLGWGGWGNTSYSVSRAEGLLRALDGGAVLDTTGYEEALARRYPLL